MDENILELLGTLCVTIFISAILNVREPIITFVLLFGILGFMQYNRNKDIKRFLLISCGIYLIHIFIEYASNHRFTRDTMVNNLWKIPFTSILLFILNEINLF